MPPPPPPATDEQLYARLRGGEAAALNELFRRHYVALVRRALRLVADTAAAEDIVQDLFVHLWDRRATLGELSGGLAAYLNRAVRNRSLNYLRDRNRIPVDDAELPRGLAALTTAPDAGLERADLSRRINGAIGRLPERCRLIFVMSKFEDMSRADIAERLAISPKTVENQMTRAYRFLREWLALFLLWVTGSGA